MMATQVLPTYWTLYEHPPGTKDWSLESYRKIAVFKTDDEVAALIATIAGEGTDRVTGAYLCMMREDTRPVYEAEENRDGGALTIRVPTDCAKDIWSSFIAHAVSDELLIPGEDPKQVKGVIISPKRGNIIIQVWTPGKVDPSILSPIVVAPIGSDVMYRPHYERI
jgi:hypothetical protein